MTYSSVFGPYFDTILDDVFVHRRGTKMWNDYASENTWNSLKKLNISYNSKWLLFYIYNWNLFLKYSWDIA